MPRNFFKSLLAVVSGNLIYFLVLPMLPGSARHHPMRLDLGLVVDAWFCVAMYGMIAMFSRSAAKSRKSKVE